MWEYFIAVTQHIIDTGRRIIIVLFSKIAVIILRIHDGISYK